MSQPRLDGKDVGTTIENPELEEQFKHHSRVAEQAKSEYQTVYRQMLANLSAEHLEPFAKVLLEREGVTLQTRDELVDALRKVLLSQMEQSLERFWEVSNVSNGLASLEMLKEKFKEFEGKDWNMQNKSVEERTMPIRMRFKESSLRYLQKQLHFQNSQLEQILNENKALRARITKITQQRIYLSAAIDKRRSDFKQIQTQLLQMQQELLAAAIDEEQLVAAETA